MLLRSDRSVSPPRANPPRSNLSPADPVSPGARPLFQRGQRFVSAGVPGR
ncbi:hypothetical protein [Lysobacter gummosus]